MTNKETIAILQKEYLCVNRNCNIERSCAKCDLMMPNKEPILQAYKTAIETLEKQEPKWIPVSEELPEEGKEVLTCSNGGFIEIQSFEDSSADIYWENQKGDWTDIDEVIAWMPLPKPHKAERSERV